MIQPGSKVYIRNWGYGNDPDDPAVVISVNRRLQAHVRWFGVYGVLEDVFELEDLLEYDNVGEVILARMPAPAGVTARGAHVTLRKIVVRHNIRGCKTRSRG